MDMRRWPSIAYFIDRDSRAKAKRDREALLAHCRSCGCIVCQVRLATMNEFFEPESESEEKIVLKDSLN